MTRTFQDAKGRAVLTTDSFVEDAAVTAANAAAFDPLTQTYSSFTFDNATASRATLSVYDGADRVQETWQLKDAIVAVVGAAPNYRTEIRVGGDVFTPPPGANGEQFFAALGAFFQSRGKVISTSSSQYDNAGRVTVSMDQFGRQTQTTYNAFGETVQTRTQSKDAAGNPVWLVSQTVYDSQGRVEVSTGQYVEGSSDPVMATRTIYDDKGRARVTVGLEGVEVGLVDGDSVVTDWGSEVWRTETVSDSRRS